MQLIITEKPSVAKTLAETIGAGSRRNGYFVGNGCLVSWCLGHLVELAMPGEYNPKYARWQKEQLPIIPTEWKYHIAEKTAAQFQTLKELMECEDVEALICATDAGREGELIFRLVYEMAGCQKPFRRLWISSLEEDSIREGFRNLKPSTEYDSLYEAALCRERADWLVGINATRLFSCLHGHTMNVGRVVTPTLQMVVKREQEIAAFVPEAFYTVQLAMDGFTAESGRLKTSWEASELLKNCLADGTAEVIFAEIKNCREMPPHLFDLTSLQREANKKYGFTAQQTLDYAQSLYEKKLLTYPRTDSCYLADDKAAFLPGLVRGLYEEILGEDDDDEDEEDEEDSTDNEDLQILVRQVLNSSKVTDHEALLPTKKVTGALLNSLPEGEQMLLRLVAMRVIEAVSEPHCYRDMKVKLSCGGSEFTAQGREEISMGWRRFEPDKREWVILPEGLHAGQRLPIENGGVREGRTKPPARYTEGTLLRAMETAGNEEMPEEAERKGIGTTATRASIIEKLIKGNFIERKASKNTMLLIPTEKGVFLISAVPESLKSPSLTAEWEQKLLLIEKKELGTEAFMNEIAEMTERIIRTADPQTVKLHSRADTGYPVIGICPHCGGDVTERPKGYFCTGGCHFSIWKDNRFIERLGKKVTRSLVTDLLAKGSTYLYGCRSPKGFKYNATLSMTCREDGKPEFNLTFDKADREKKKGRRK